MWNIHILLLADEKYDIRGNTNINRSVHYDDTCKTPTLPGILCGPRK